jgi:hypothetical protein
MRRLLLVWCLLLSGIGCLSQSEAFWQSRDSNYNKAVGAAPLISLTIIGTNSGAGNNVTTTVDCPVGDALFMVTGANDTDTTVASASDGTANSYSSYQNTATSALYNGAISYSLNLAHDVPSGSTLSATETSGADGGYVQAAVCVTGANSGLDKSVSVVEASAVSTFTLTTGTLTQANEIIFEEWVPTTSVSYTEASGFTPLTTCSATVGLCFAYTIVTATTSVTASPSSITPTTTLTAAMASFKH